MKRRYQIQPVGARQMNCSRLQRSQATKFQLATQFKSSTLTQITSSKEKVTLGSFANSKLAKSNCEYHHGQSPITKTRRRLSSSPEALLHQSPNLEDTWETIFFDLQARATSEIAVASLRDLDKLYKRNYTKRAGKTK